MLTRTYTTSGAQRAASHPILRFNKTVKTQTKLKDKLMELDKGQLDSDPRDGYVRHKSIEGQAAGPGFYRNGSLLLETNQGKTKLSSSSQGSGTERRFEFDENTQTLTATAFSETEKESRLENTDSISYQYSGGSVPTSKHARGCVQSMDYHRELALEAFSENGLSSDRSANPWVFDGSPLFMSTWGGVEHVKVKKFWGRLNGQTRLDSNPGSSFTSFNLSKSGATTEHGLPLKDASLKVVDGGQTKNVEWDADTKVLNVERTFRDPEPFLFATLED